MRFNDLYESTSYLLLETPQRAAWLVSNRGQNLLAKYEEESKHGLIPAEVSRQIDMMDGENTAEKLVKFIMSFDPTPAKAKVAAKIVIDTSNRGGNRFEEAVVYGTGADRIRWSEGFRNFMYGPADVASGSGPKFKDSPLYRSCGVRGTGGFEWFTLFGEKILEHGGVSIWRQGRVVSIADDNIGLVATGKKAKDGSFTVTEKFAELDDKKLEKIFALMKGKL